MSDYTIGAGAIDARWYKPEYRDERHKRISPVVKRIWSAQQYRRDNMLRHARLYGNLPIMGLSPRSYARKAIVSKGGRLSLNVIKACADTYAAKLTKDRPKVTFVTSGGNWSLQEKAKKLDRFVEGQFYEADLYELAPRIIMDTAVFGTGFVKIYIDDHDQDEPRIEIDRVLPWEVLVDDEEACYGEPRTIYQRKWIDKHVLKEMFPDWEREITEAPRDEIEGDAWGYDSTADQVLVTEAWHLKSGKDADDGIHSIIINTATLFDEEWRWSWLPIEPLRRQPPLVGYWGIGIAEELTGIQLELNVLIDKIRKSHHLLAAGHWVVQKGSINKQKLDNDIGSIIEYVGSKPELEVGMTVSPEVYQHADRLYAKAFELSGISMQAAQSLKPPGIVSGEGLRVYSDISTERFQVSFREYQHWFLKLAHRIIDLAGAISDEHPSFAVKATGSRTMSRVIFRDAFLREEEYSLKLYPTNALATDPASRIEQVRAFADAGWIDPVDAKRMLDFPDLQAESSFENAAYDLLMDVIERLKEERYIAPEPFMNLADGIRRMQLAYLRHKHDTLDDDDQAKVERVLELMRRWMTDAQGLLEDSKKGGNDGGGGEGGAPPDAGAVPPPPDAGGPTPGGPMPPPAPGAMPPEAGPPMMPPNGTGTAA